MNLLEFRSVRAAYDRGLPIRNVSQLEAASGAAKNHLRQHFLAGQVRDKRSEGRVCHGDANGHDRSG